MVNRKKINDFLETGKNKQEIEKLLLDESFRRQYLEQTRMESALYEVWEAKSSLKLKKKPRRIPFYRIMAIAALLAVAFFFYRRHAYSIATYIETEASVKPGESLLLTEDAEFILKDGSRLNFKGPSKVIFIDEDNIKVQDGFLVARIKPRPVNKFRIQTPSGPFTVIGTEFTLWVKDDSTLLSVSEGKVAVADQFVEANERALLKNNGELLTREEELEFLSAGLVLKKLAASPSASLVSDFSVSEGHITNMVTGEKVRLENGIEKSSKGLIFNEQGSIQVKAAGEPGLEWNLSLWLKLNSSRDRKAIISHENFVDKNMGGWNLYCFNDFLRMHTVMQPYLHDRGDFKQNSPEWFHMSINVKSLGHGTVEERIYINGALQETHRRKMLFLKNQVNLYLGGLSINAMSAFPESMKNHNFYFKGEMANLVYMNAVLSEAEIKELYESSAKSFK